MSKKKRMNSDGSKEKMDFHETVKIKSKAVKKILQQKRLGLVVIIEAGDRN